jgi:hypothetical protein
MSGFQRLAQLRPGPVVSAIPSPAGPGSMGGHLRRKPILELLLPFLGAWAPGCAGPLRGAGGCPSGSGRGQVPMLPSRA